MGCLQGPIIGSRREDVILAVSTGDPFFGAGLVFVLIGISLTRTSYLLDRRGAAS